MKPRSNRFCRAILQRILYTGAAGWAMLASHATSATVTMTASDSGSTQSFNSAGNWSNAAAPSAGNDYESNGFLIQYSPQIPVGGYTFAGDSLTLKGAARFASGAETIGGGRWITINNLTLDNGRISHSRGGGNPLTMTGSMTIAAGGATLYAEQDSLTWAGSVTGSGPLAITQGTVNFTGSQSHTSNVTISSGATFSAAPSGTLANSGTMIFSHGDSRSFDASGYSGNGSISKRGAGTLTTSGAWSITGNLQVGYGQVGNSGSVVLGSGSSLSVGSGSSNNFYVGVGTGTDGSNGPTATLNASASNGVTANVGIFRVGGTVGGNGTLNLGATNTITAATEFGVNHGQWGFPNGFGAVTTAASSTTTINTPSLIVGKTTPNGTTGGYGEFTLGDGATFNLAGTGGGRTTMEIGIHNSGNGASHGTSFMNLAGNGTGVADLKLSSLVLGDLQGGNSNGVTGNLTLSSSASNQLNISGNSSGVAVVQVARSRAGAPATATLTIGHLGSVSQIVSQDNGTAILLARKESSGTATGTLNLGAGTLTLTTTGSAIAGGGGTSNLNIDGTTLKAGASSSTWIQSLTNAKIKSGGVTFDTNGYNITIPQALIQDTSSTGGGLTKLGSGTLTLSGANTFSGATVVSNGKLVISSGSALLSSSVSIGTNAELRFNPATALSVAPQFTGTGGTFGGAGTVTPAVTITSGNHLAPGDSGGTLTLNGGLTLANGAGVKIESPGSSLAQVNGDFTDSLGSHALLISGTPTLNQPYTFLQWTGSNGSLTNGEQAHWSLAPTVQGVSAKWVGTSPSGEWTTSNNWMVVDGYSGSVVADLAAKTLTFTLTGDTGTPATPVASNDVAIDPTTSNIQITGPATAVTVNSLRVGGAYNSSPVLTLGSGSMNVTTTVTVTGNGTLTATNAALTAPTLNVSGNGAVTLGHASGAVTTANVSGGSITVGAGTLTTANVTSGTLTVNGGSVPVANLSGTGILAGSQAIPQVNVTGGTPGFSGNATVMTITGGGITTTGGTVGTLNHNTGSGTSTVGANTLVTTANLRAGTIQFNSTQSNGTLTLPAASTGTFVAGAGARFAIVDLTAGAGTVTAENPLTITSELLLPDLFSATTSGPAFTVQSAPGENLTNNAASRTFTANGGTLTLAVEGAPAVTGISYTQVTNDATSGISSDKTYTHAVDWGTSGAATVNGVAFATDMNQSVGGRSNSGSRTYGSSNHGGNTPPNVSGNVASVFQDMLFGGPDMGYIELTGLTAGAWYGVKLYERAWDYYGSVRTYYNLFDVGGNGSVEYTTPKIDQNRANLTPPGMSGNVSWVTSYVYQADNTGKMKVTIDLANDQNGTYHLYGLTNELVPAGSGIVNMPDTHIAAAATSEINLGSPTSAHQLGNLSVAGSDAVVTLGGAQNVSFNNITATHSGSIAAGTPISLRGGDVSVASGKALTIATTVQNGASSTAVTKTGAGTLTLSGVNTYTGNTTVSAGAMVLADNAGLSFTVTNSGSNKVTGAGSATFHGDFTINTTAVTAGVGTWALVDTGTKSFSSTFTIAGGWTESNNVWTLVSGANTWKFSETTGLLSLNPGFSAWANSYQPGLVANQDPDGDGLTNLQEYAFGTNPSSGSPGAVAYANGAVTNRGAPTTSTTSITNGVDFRAVFTRRKDYQVAGLVYTVQFSAGLDVWVNSTATPTVIATDDTVEAVSVPYPFFIPTARGVEKPTFFRVGVTAP